MTHDSTSGPEPGMHTPPRTMRAAVPKHHVGNIAVTVAPEP